MTTTLNTAAETKKAIDGMEDVFSRYVERCKAEGMTWNELYEAPESQELQSVIRDLKNELRYLEVREIKAYANLAMYTDVLPYEVVKVISDKTVEVRAMDTKQTKVPKEFTPGGFVGHFADNRSGQEYEYSSNENNPVIRIRWSERNRQWQNGTYTRFRMSNKPYKFHDYNF